MFSLVSLAAMEITQETPRQEQHQGSTNIKPRGYLGIFYRYTPTAGLTYFDTVNLGRAYTHIQYQRWNYSVTTSRAPQLTYPKAIITTTNIIQFNTKQDVNRFPRQMSVTTVPTCFWC
jgi:hypothetical protein